MCVITPINETTVFKTKHMPSAAAIFVEFDILVPGTNRSLLVPRKTNKYMRRRRILAGSFLQNHGRFWPARPSMA